MEMTFTIGGRIVTAVVAVLVLAQRAAAVPATI
jgi:hypothetical protein